MVNGVAEIDGVTFHDLYEEYPDFYIDVEREKALLEGHDRIVWQHPLYWYSSPALLKQWFDVVLQYGWAYGPGGDALKGKTVKSVITTGSGPRSYDRKGHHRFSIDEFLRPFEQTAVLCGMVYEEPIVFFKALESEGDELAEAASTYHRWLSQK